MQVKYCGPRKEIIVAPYGPHRKGDVKEYPDDFAEELMATSKKQQFEAVDPPSAPPEDEMTVAQLKEVLDGLGIEYDDKAKKAELIELYKGAAKVPPETDDE